jgi:hypothetical protein
LIIVFATEQDDSAALLVRQWADLGAKLMTPADLSCAGWRVYSDFPNSRSVIQGLSHDSSEVHGVLVRWPNIVASELYQIIPSDREYVAAEMNAFMIYWLGTLRCPVLNRPTARSISGPGWYPEHWNHAAARAGLKVQPVRRISALDGSQHPGIPSSSIALSIVGDRVFGEATSELIAKARALAKIANVELVTFYFDSTAPDPKFVWADILPPLTPLLQSAIFDYFVGAKAGAY